MNNIKLYTFLLLITLPIVSCTKDFEEINTNNNAPLKVTPQLILPAIQRDPVVFSLVVYPPKFKYLARGDAFKPGIAAYLLESLGLAPIYRIQDGGKEGLQKNSETYDRVNYFLRKRSKIIVFAEGLCIQERRLRPIKKGVPRMVFGAMDAIQNPDFVVVPVGINYSEASKVGSSMFYNIGEPIRVADFYEEYKEHPSKTYNKLIKVLEPRMKDLITHIDNPENDKLVPWLEKIFMRDLCKQQKFKFRDPEHEFIIAKEITEKVNTADQEQKETG